MRLIKRDQKEVVFKERIPMKEPDGTPYEEWSQDSLKIKGNLQPAGGKVMAEQYGERLGYIMVMYCEFTPESLKILEEYNSQKKGFGACVYAPHDSEPDYKIVAIRGWRHVVIELEKVI
ncbi:hypothetical protein DMN77_08055 [Paenibacillus sp. 79R4]|uniref:hypothetical protein n=1 Tax=Paenibacillus sp. 79R4 TaxID=2212847 RepID=UPI0015BD449A|nr:hypothetical protein [Paenibacillus sp. 79R4]NWL87556.1 hypothetical protein [Paenibacillus sp. 79R4]